MAERKYPLVMFPGRAAREVETAVNAAVKTTEAQVWARAKESYDATITEEKWLAHDAVFMPSLIEGKGRIPETQRRKHLDRSRLNFLYNPLIVRTAQTYWSFVFGRGISRPKLSEDWVKMLQEGTKETEPELAKVIEKIVVDFWHDPTVQYFLTGYRAQQDRYTQLLQDGEIPILLFEKDGSFTASVLDSSEMTDVLPHPEIPGLPILWKREYRDAKDRQNIEWYRATESFGYDAEVKSEARVMSASTWGNGGLREITKDGSRIWLYRVRVNRHDPLSMRGHPPFYSALSWSAAVQESTANLKTYCRALASWAWKLKLQGTAADIASSKTQLGSLLDRTNPKPTVAAIRIEGQGQDLEPINLGTGGANSFEIAIKHCLNMVYAAVGLPAHYFGDVEQGTLATARDTELSVRKLFEAEQQFWTAAYDGLFQTMARLIGKEIVTERLIELDFPTISEKDLPAIATAMATAAGAGAVSPDDACRTIATAAGADDIEDWLKRLEQSSMGDTETPTELTAAIEADPVRMAPVVLRWSRKVREAVAREAAKSNGGSNA